MTLGSPGRLVQHAEGYVQVSHSLLSLRLVAAPFVTSDDDPVPDHEGIRADANGVLADSGCEYQIARVRLERWSAEPEPLDAGTAPQAWECTAQAVLEVAVDDQLAATGLFDDESGPVRIDLRAGGYTVRAYSRGRTEAAERYLADLDDDSGDDDWSGPVGVEEHLFQLWPVAPSGASRATT